MSWAIAFLSLGSCGRSYSRSGLFRRVRRANNRAPLTANCSWKSVAQALSPANQLMKQPPHAIFHTCVPGTLLRRWLRRHSNSLTGRLRRLGNLIRFLVNHTNPVAFEGVCFAIELATVALQNQREFRHGAGVVHLHRIVPHHLPLNVSRLVAMVFAAPDEHAETVEFVRLQAFRDGGPKPVVLVGIAALEVS